MLHKKDDICLQHSSYHHILVPFLVNKLHLLLCFGDVCVFLLPVLADSYSHFDGPLFLNFTTCNLTSLINKNNGINSV